MNKGGNTPRPPGGESEENMEKYQSVLCLFGQDVRVNIKKIVFGEVTCESCEKVVATANELVDSLKTNKARAKELIDRFRKDFEYALTDDTFHHDDVRDVLDTLDRMEATYL